MKTLLLTLAMLSFSFAVGLADRPLELDSGTYTFTWTEGSNAVKFPVRLTATLSTRVSYLDVAKIVIEPETDNLLFQPNGKFEGYSTAVYTTDGKLSSADIALAMTTINPKDMRMMTVQVKGHISNHSVTGEGAYFVALSKSGDLKWSLTKVQD